MTRCIWIDVDSVFPKNMFPEYQFNFNKKNVWALAPLLDGLNHSPTSQVGSSEIIIVSLLKNSNEQTEGYWNKMEARYEIRSNQSWEKNEQVGKFFFFSN